MRLKNTDVADPIMMKQKAVATKTWDVYKVSFFSNAEQKIFVVELPTPQ